MMIAPIASLPIQRLGWTLLHFLWQGTVIALAYAAFTRIGGNRLSSRTRYPLACAALLAQVLAPIATFYLLSDALPPSARSSAWSIPLTAGDTSLQVIVAFWALGVLFFSIRLFGGWRYLARLRASSNPAPADWQTRFEQIAARMGASPSHIWLRISPFVHVPTVIGALKPYVLMPIDALTGWPTEECLALIAHEIAHIVRHDFIVNILQNIAEALLFYHPAVWWISGQIRATRELCCDDMAVLATDPLSYSNALLSLESRRASVLRHAVAANGGSLRHRISRLLDPAGTRESNLPSPIAAWAMTILWLAGLGTVSLHASPPQPVVAPQAVTASKPKPFADHVRNTLLYDPILVAQNPAPPPAVPAPAADLPSDRWKNWLDEDVAYIVTDAERKAFQSLQTDAEREQFVEQFWLRRDPTPNTPQNEFRDEHYRRIAYANEHFSTQRPGWKTTRGRTYIQHGPPDEIDSRPRVLINGEQYPTENWRYRYLADFGPNVVFLFTDTERNGEYRSIGFTTQENQSSQIVTVGRHFELPAQLRVDYLRVTDASDLANITMVFADLGQTNVTGRITTMSGRLVTTFEKPAVHDPGDYSLMLQQSVPLPPGRYRLDVVVDPDQGKQSPYEVALDVPRFDQSGLTTSSLILADQLERRSVTSGLMFAIGDYRVRPRVSNRFRSHEKLGVYMQVYNAQNSGTVTYQVRRADSDYQPVNFSEELAGGRDQVTIAKLLPLSDLARGSWILAVSITDRSTGQVITREAPFTIN